MATISNLAIHGLASNVCSSNRSETKIPTSGFSFRGDKIGKSGFSVGLSVHRDDSRSLVVQASKNDGNGVPVTKTTLHDLYEKEGQSPWYDNLCRPVADLLPLIARGVRGVTSNPSIFQKAISSSSAYDEQFRQLVSAGKDIESAYWELVIKDIQDACNLFESVYDETDGADGYVSVEVSPRLANDTNGTVEAAKWLHKLVNCRNAYIKIPATAECVPSIRDVIANNISVNVTLIFSLSRYEEVIDAYLDGLESSGLSDLSKLTSVASFFVSRVDTLVDKMLENIGTPEALDLRGIWQNLNEKILISSFLEGRYNSYLHLWHGLRSISSIPNTQKFDLTDLTCPHTWYPNARRKKRKVFLHVGPTNSGKTYNALKRLQSSSSGIYCGPLRLLAWEVAKRLNKAQVPCDLITGQERDEIDGANHSSVTVEMADVTGDYQCAVIDEIQMIACRTRGYSFTRALLGICSDELHVCGDPAAVPLIQRILEVTNDIVQVQYYERLSPLVPSRKPLGSFSNIRTGDCIVTFSRREIYTLKKQIEQEAKHLCSVVYGSLPPETRTKQASKFNDESTEFDVLVASDAIGMGLNLNISRIIFSTLQKFDGIQTRDLTVPEIKQIAGRAGRYGSKFPVGEVTCLDGGDLRLLHSSLKSPSPVLERAGLFPTYDILALFSRLQSTTRFHFILAEFLEKAKLSSDYFIADCEEILKVAAVVDDFPLGLHDKYLFCISPVDMNDDISAQALVQFAGNYAKTGVVRLREIFTPGSLVIPRTQNELKELESIHKVLDLYVWLSFRMEESFPDRKLASSQKAACSLLIEEFLERLGSQKSSHRMNQKLLKKKYHDVLQVTQPTMSYDKDR